MSPPWLKPDPKPSSTPRKMRGKLAVDTRNMNMSEETILIALDYE